MIESMNKTTNKQTKNKYKRDERHSRRLMGLCAEELCTMAVSKGSTDDITVTLMRL